MRRLATCTSSALFVGPVSSNGTRGHSPWRSLQRDWLSPGCLSRRYYSIFGLGCARTVEESCNCYCDRPSNFCVGFIFELSRRCVSARVRAVNIRGLVAKYFTFHTVTRETTSPYVIWFVECISVLYFEQCLLCVYYHLCYTVQNITRERSIRL